MLGLVISVMIATTVFADVTSGPYNTPTINGKKYSFTSEVWERGSSSIHTAEAVVLIKSSSGNVPAGYMGGHARLFTSGGTLWSSGVITYNTVAVSNHYNYSPPTSTKGLYYAQNRAYFYNGNGYDEYTGYQSPFFTLGASFRSAPDRMNALQEIRSRSAYEKNDNGETYGSALSAETIGQEPALIAAIGTNGVEGYVRSSDFATGVTSPEEAIAYMNNLGNSIPIPLYDVNGSNVLGEFVLEHPTK
jgi:hypothetical protein